jgi:alpha-galactosidase
MVPGSTGGGTVTTTVTNRGYHGLRHVAVSADAPEGWTVTATTSSRRSTLPTDASLSTTWKVTVPDGTAAGRYPITFTAAYEWGRERTDATSSSEVIAIVVTAPADGRRYLSSVLQVSSTNAVGPAEVDQSNGGSSQGDGALITIGGQVFTRGIGTTAPGEIVYYLGGHCTRLTTSVGIDDEAATTLPATFTIYADDTVAAASGPVAAGDAPKALTADLTGATTLRLVTTGSGAAPDGTTLNVHTDWAVPVLTCGDAGPDDPILPVERTLFSFESGTDGFAPANADPGGSVAQSTAFHTDGAHSLEITVPTSGNWFGTTPAQPFDISGATQIKYDVKTAAAGTSGEIALQVGESGTWCQGGLWSWTNPNSSRTVTEKVSAIGCPAGVTLDLSQVRAVWVFVNGTGVQVDNIRAE